MTLNELTQNDLITRNDNDELCKVKFDIKVNLILKSDGLVVRALDSQSRGPRLIWWFRDSYMLPFLFALVKKIYVFFCNSWKPFITYFCIFWMTLLGKFLFVWKKLKKNMHLFLTYQLSFLWNSKYYFLWINMLQTSFAFVYFEIAEVLNFPYFLCNPMEFPGNFRTILDAKRQSTFR